MTELATLGARLSALISVSHRRDEPPILAEDLAEAADAAGPAHVPVSLITALVADESTVSPTPQQVAQIAHQFPIAPDSFLTSEDAVWVDGVLCEMDLLCAMRDGAVASIHSCRSPGALDPTTRRSLARAIRDTDDQETVRDETRRRAFSAPEPVADLGWFTPPKRLRWWQVGARRRAR